MVIVNDFEFQLVSAEDKTPFKEHGGEGGKTYVEVEPDVEYYLSIRKVRPLLTGVVCHYKVDGKQLDYHSTFFDNNFDGADTMYNGIVSWSNGVERNRALKFVKAKFTSGDAGIGSTMAGMGTVDLIVSKAIYSHEYYKTNHTCSLATPTIKMEDGGGDTMKKNVRSAEGSCVETSTYDSNESMSYYETGKHLYTITLYYCATPGLIAVGVLPKPPLWDWHRMTKPSDLTAGEKRKLEKAVISEKRTRKGDLILQLCDSDSDSDSDSGTPVHPDETPSNHKKIRN